MISIVSSANPEVDRLAGELRRRGELQKYVRRYAYRDRTWENLALALPTVRRRLNSLIDRRALPPYLNANDISDAGIVFDFLAGR